MSTRVDKIQQLLSEALAPAKLELYDDSASHSGHAGNREGGGHFYATIVSSVFEGMSLLRRHQVVYETLGEMMHTDIHALSIKAFTPEEFEHKN